MPASIGNNIGFESSELIVSGVTKSTLYRYLSEGKVKAVEHKGERYIVFNSLPYKWQQLVVQHYGDPKRYCQFEVIKANAACPIEDASILKRYRKADGMALDAQRRETYKKSCGVLAFLGRVMPLKRDTLDALSVRTKGEFWDLMYSYIKEQGIKLPSSRRLKTNVKNYQKNGALSVISGKLGQGNNSKLTENHKKLIVELYADRDGRKFTQMQVWEQFTALAHEYNWTNVIDITYQTICNVIAAHRQQWMLERHGSKHWMLNNTLVINRKRATAPNVAWQLDGTPEHLWYWDEERRTIDKVYVFKVMDSHSWKIVGYSIGNTETSTLVFEAMKRACTVHQVKPLEVRADKGPALQSGETKALMSQLGCNYFPTATGNARAKTIEAWQGTFNEQVLTWFANKSGANLTAKSLDSQQNPDKLKEFAKTYPTKQELVERIAFAIGLWNERKEKKTGKSPNQKYHQGKASKGRPLDILEQFDLFSIFRKKGDKIVPYKLTPEGISFKVSGRTYRYLPSLPASELATFINTHLYTSTFYVKHDPSDMAQVGLYALPAGLEPIAENMQFMTEAVIKGQTAETPIDATEEDLKLYNKYRKTQKEQLKQAKKATEDRRKLLSDENILAGAIQLERVQKDWYNAAQIELQRQKTLGHLQIADDYNRELSERSLIEDDTPKWASSIPKKDQGDNPEPLDVYG